MSEFGQLLVSEIPALRRYACKLTRDAVEAEDLVQNCLTRALLKKELWQPGTDLRRWLFTMLYHQRITALRRARRERDNLGEAGQALAAAAAADPASRLLADELVEAISALPAGQREAIRLVAIGDMDYTEAAERMAVPIGTLRSRLARARVTLRRFVDDNPDPGVIVSLRRPPKANAADQDRRLAA